MKKFKILKHILHVTGTSRLLLGFVSFVLVTAYAIWIVEKGGHSPEIKTFFDALYFSIVTVCTVGFGDMVVTTVLGKILAVSLMIYGVLMIGLITGIFASFYDEVSKIRDKETINQFIDKLEHLPELSHEELTKLSKRVIKYRAK